MDYRELVASMTPEIYERMTRALELGKWPDGRKLTPEQREQTMQAVILWGEEHLPVEDRVGFVRKKDTAGDACDEPGETTLKWR